MPDSMEIETPFGAAVPEIEEQADENLEEESTEDLEDETSEEEDLGDDEEGIEEEDSDETENEEETDEDDDSDEDDDTSTENVRQEISSLTEEGDACAALLAQHQISYLDLKAEIEENGKLSKASLDKLNAAGFSEKLVAGYIEGQQARYQASYVDRIFKQAGGEEAYGKLMQWASKNLSQKDVARFDKAVESNDIDIALTAVENLMNRREKIQGVKPKLVPGRSPKSTGSVRGYTSLEEMADAMDDPRYEKNSDYTRKVDRRIAASNF